MIRQQWSYKDLCEDIANELKRKNIILTNKTTGKIIESAEDVYNFSSNGELFHVIEWYISMFPERVEFDKDHLTFRIKR